ncbi:heterogeneous nuclear ribonucleoproteins A2/B1 isoform X2 [Selaginella moellendorffii]|uniref:heterogeneous nuclear ribonucleoproteins A2/B1 isoform X2 n=1 Tax=Selaginella moellendorffii TaxID=88036 RepID=UPI000D1CBB58|nr:heterogeneous nuclear ribonucleoproteins A2/B1 isoform X2 [Selaginella moellendorffii]XP_024531225.1 heterogeneous nuclear ribonucleoproteins A2/B1 isoform X2 [Selaginella moellendorffii]|eukprot:XP_024527956.1 heterogeneous nuclear ribonucleoproteins A2/B1 isoform X2 [Selaginella moellendorffii]
MAGGISMSLGNRKLVVLGIPWDVDTEGLRSYMTKFGGLDDVIVMKDRSTGRSRGFGYVTFTSSEDAEKALLAQHSLSGRILEVKVATPKEEMLKPKVTRVFVARIPPSVNDDTFRNYFEKYGRITDAYMPKDQGSKAHRGIGFVTYEDPDSVEKLMGKTHELAGSTIAVDRATPKEETMKFWGKSYPSIYGPYGIYTNAAARFGAFGTHFGSSAFGAYDYPPALATEIAGSGIGGAYGAGLWSSPAPPPANMMGGPAGPVSAPMNISSSQNRGIGKKIFVGRLPLDATAEDLRRYFGNFGRLLDVYVPKDAKKLSHRGFGFVTFADESVADRVALRSHELLGVQIAVDRATPQDEAGAGSGTASYMGPSSILQGAGGPMRGASAIAGSAYGLGGYDYNGAWLYGDAGHRPSRMETRYRPY